MYTLMLGSRVMQRVLSGVSKSTRAKPLEGFLDAGKNGNRSILVGERLAQGRFLSGMAWVDTPSQLFEGLLGRKEVKTPSWGCYNAVQSRGFLGAVGENPLPKTYEERRVIGYSPEQLYNVVAAVDMYEDFLPWCQRSQILQRHGDGSFDAELQIGFKFFVENYISRVELKRSESVKSTVSESALFDHLVNVWDFNPGPLPGTCNVYFYVDFKFKSALYSQVSSMFFAEVVSCLVRSFTDRCRLIYGPEKKVLESSYQQSAAC